MGEGIADRSSFRYVSSRCPWNSRCFCCAEFARDEILLYLLECFGFGQVGLGEGLVKLLHHEGGAGVIH